MDLSILIAKLFSVVYAAMGLGMLINMKFYKKLFNDMYKTTTFIFAWGIFATTVGLFIVLNHNIWVADWTVIITVIGWIALFKGLSMLIFPNILKISEKMFKGTGFLYAIGVFALIFGCVLGYFGWL